MANQIDKALVNGSDLGLTSTGDIQTVSDSTTILQTAQNRCLAEIDTWGYDVRFGNTLPVVLKQESVWNLTEGNLFTYISGALQSMLDDGRITELKYTKIISKASDSLVIEIGLVIGTQLGTITYEVTNF